MKRCFAFLKNYLDSERARNRIIGPFSLEDDWNEEFGDFAAIYFFVSKEHHYILPWGNSPIIYIGKADKLRQRLLNHLTDFNNKNPKSEWVYSRYNFMRMSGGFEVYYLRVQGRETAKCLESKVLEDFYDRYGALPVGNGAFSFR